MIPDATVMKHCPGCDVTQAANEFYADARRKDGLQAHCKVCCREDTRFHRLKRKALKQARTVAA